MEAMPAHSCGRVPGPTSEVEAWSTRVLWSSPALGGPLCLWLAVCLWQEDLIAPLRQRCQGRLGLGLGLGCPALGPGPALACIAECLFDLRGVARQSTDCAHTGRTAGRRLCQFP